MQVQTASYGSNTDITKFKKVNIWALFTLKIFQKNENVRKMSQQQQQAQ